MRFWSTDRDCGVPAAPTALRLYLRLRPSCEQFLRSTRRDRPGSRQVGAQLRKQTQRGADFLRREVLLRAQYAMRIWLDPAKLNNYGLMPLDVSNAVKAQNVQVASGELGGLPAVGDQQLSAPRS